MEEIVLVTGGSGYIGSHAVVELLEEGYKVIVIDSLENGYIELLDNRVKFYQGDLRDLIFLEKVFLENKIDVVIHFAAYIKAPESIEVPTKYFSNNIYSTICLLEMMNRYQVRKIIFSSTAAVYGEVKGNKKITEKNLTLPINPYGMSKLMAENIIKECSRAYNLKYVIFRYFNVAGAHMKYKIGQMDDTSTALIPKLTKAAIKTDVVFNIFGNNYPTYDGTCVRDFIHVVDLVKAHVKAVNYLKDGTSEIFNLGSEKGYSVLEIFNSFEKILNKKISVKILEKREGDPTFVIASSEKAYNLLGWKTIYKIDDIIKSSIEWENKCNEVK